MRERLTETAEPVLETCEEGHGLVDARAALEGETDGDNSLEDGREGSDLTESGRLGSALEWVSDAITGLLEWIRGLFT